MPTVPAVPTVRRWFSISDQDQQRIETQIADGDRLASYGIVRASLACHNTASDVDRLLEALRDITRNGPRQHYRATPEHESYELV